MKIKDFFFILLFIFLIGIIFFSGLIYGVILEEKNSMYVGCWKKVSETNRAITIRVENQSLEEIKDTLRHEFCHEIQYRTNDSYRSLNKEQKEKFAKSCNPEDYLFYSATP